MSDKRLRIAILQTPTAPLNIELHGGLERVELCELDWLIKNRHSVKLYASKVIGNKTNVFPLFDLGWKNRILKFFYYFNFGIRNLDCEIFHGHFTPILALLYPKKSVVHFHGLGVHELVLYRYFKKRYHLAHYIFCTRWVLEEFREIYPDIPESHLHVVYNGVDTAAIKPFLDRSIGETVNICFYAGWIPEKGIYEVLSAAEILEKKGRRDFTIHFGGSAYSHYKDSKWGDSADIDRRVREWAQRLKTVELVGNIKYRELPEFLGRMDMGLVPSTYPEPFGIVNIEIMACGLPVIATKVGGIPEIVVDGETGLLIEPNNPHALAAAIENLIDDPALRIKMGKTAREHVEKNFTWENHICQLLDIYEKILDSQKSKSLKRELFTCKEN